MSAIPFSPSPVPRASCPFCGPVHLLLARGCIHKIPREYREITFIVEQDPDGGLTAHAVGTSIFTQADTPEQLRENVRDAVRCHFPDESSRPKIIRLHHVAMS